MAGDLRLAISIDVLADKAKTAFASVQNDIGKTTGFIKEHQRQFELAGAGMVAVGAGITAAFGKATADAARYGDQLAKASDKTGVSVESFGRLGYAAERASVGFGALEVAMFRQARAANEAAQGTGSGAEAYAALGISVKDASGRLKDGETLFKETAEALSKLDNDTQKTALAMDIFGRSGAQLLPMMKDGAAGIEEMGKRAEDLGLVMDEETARMSEAYNDMMEDIKSAGMGIATSIGQVLMPILTRGAEIVVDLTKRVREFAQEHPQLTQFVVAAAGAFGALLIPLGTIVMALPRLIMAYEAYQKATLLVNAALKGQSIWTAAVSAAHGVAAVVTGGLSVAYGVLATAAKLAWKAVLGPIGWVIAGIGLVAGAVMLVIKHWDVIGPFFVRLWDGIKNVFSAVGQWLWTFFLTCHPVGMIIKNWEPITEWFGRFWEGIKKVFGAAGQWLWDLFLTYHPVGMIIKHWEPITQWFTNLWDGVKEVFRNMWDWVKDAGARFWETFVTGLRNTMMFPYEVVKATLKKIRDLLPFSDAKTGPLSELTASGQSFFEAWGAGVSKGFGSALRAVTDNLATVAMMADETAAREAAMAADPPVYRMRPQGSAVPNAMAANAMVPNAMASMSRQDMERAVFLQATQQTMAAKAPMGVTEGGVVVNFTVQGNVYGEGAIKDIVRRELVAAVRQAAFAG